MRVDRFTRDALPVFEGIPVDRGLLLWTCASLENAVEKIYELFDVHGRCFMLSRTKVQPDILLTVEKAVTRSASRYACSKPNGFPADSA